MISQKAISDYKAIYEKEFGIVLSEQEASEQGEKLLRLFKLIYSPLKKEWIKKINKQKE